MSLNYCRLCVNIGLDFKSLYDEHGNANEVYELTTKYFDKSILNIDDAKHLTLICLQCWEHIWDFNNFQQAVHMAQSNLDAVKKIEIATPAIEKSDANVTEDLYHNVSSTKDTEAGCINLLESDEAPVDTRIEANEMESLEKTDGDLTRVDLTLDEDADSSNVDSNELADEEFDDPVGVFIGGEFTNENEIIHHPQSELELIDIDSDSNFTSDEYSKVRTPETLSACETDNNDLDVESRTNVDNNPSSIAQTAGKSSSSSSLIQKANNDKDKKVIAKPMANLKCAICFESCYRYYILREHFNRMHSSKNIQALCCNQRYTGLTAISAHVTSHKTPAELSCELCGKTYVRRYYLMRHIVKNHPEEGKQR